MFSVPLFREGPPGRPADTAEDQTHPRQDPSRHEENAWGQGLLLGPDLGKVPTSVRAKAPLATLVTLCYSLPLPSHLKRWTRIQT